MDKENKYDNEYTYENEDYEEEKDNSQRNKLIAIIILVVLLIIVIILLLKGCTKKEFSREKTLLEAGKEYYTYNEKELPSGKGLCNEVTLKELVSLGMLNPDKYEGCDDNNTYVRVCRLESANYQYTPVLMCDNKSSLDDYGKFAEGNESDLIKDESDVKFSYKVEYLDIKADSLGKEETFWYDEIPYKNYKTIRVVKYYSYKDKQYIWNIKTAFYYPNDKTNPNDIKEYYVSTPASEYTNKTTGTEGVAKWYKLTVPTGATKIYYSENGETKFSATQPEGYPYNEGGYIVYGLSRDYTSNNNGTSTFAPYKYYKCGSTTKPNMYNNTIDSCDKNTNGYTIFVENYYTCGAAEDQKVSASSTCAKSCSNGTTLGPDGTTCGVYSDWKTTSAPCTGTSQTCKNYPKGPVTFYKWYKYSSETRSYYPSGSIVASGEKTYYLTSPAEGYIKDDSTITTGYKWYKNVDSITGNFYTFAPQSGATKTSSFKYTDWSNYSPTYVAAVEGTREVKTKSKYTIKQVLGTEEEGTWKEVNEDYTEDTEKILESLKALGYDLKEFEEIEDFDDLKYSIKMYYRNKEVK